MRSYFKTTAGKITCCVILLAVLIVASVTIASGDSNESTTKVKTEQVTTTTVDPGPSKQDLEKVWIAVQTNRNVERWNNTIKWVNTTNWVDATNARLAAEQAAREQAAREQAAEQQKQTSRRTSANTPGNGRCGGNLPPCCVMDRESGGNITAQNPTSSASGKWQFLSSTWGNYMGYPTAASAPEWVQDQRAAELWAGGAGASHWGGGC